MPRLALILLSIYLALAFGLRSLVHWRRTGSTGFRGLSGRVGSAEWCGGLLFAAALLGAALAPLAESAGVLAPLPLLDRPSVRFAGIMLAVLGGAATLWSQVTMGASWRIGVDARERTALVAAGPFRWVRNPIFSSMVVALAGLALLTPNALAATALAALIGALQLQVRRVEEPYLLATHGPAYRAYAARTGRFVPGIGRLAGA